MGRLVCIVASLWRYVGSLGTLASMHTMPQGNLSQDSQYPRDASHPLVVLHIPHIFLSED